MNMYKVGKSLFIELLFLMIVSGAIIWVLLYKNWQLRSQLTWISPLTLEINFFLILIGFLLNVKLFQTVVRRISRRTWILVMMMTLGGILLTTFVAPRTHRILYDEDTYLNIGQNIAYMKRAAMCNEGRYLYGEYQCYQLEYNKEPNGWSYLISLLFRISNPSHLAGFLLNNLLRGGSILVVFFIGFFLFKDEKVGLFGALMFALIPEGIRWSNTVAVEPGAAFFAGLALLSVIVFVRNPETRFLFLAAVLLPFAFQFRPETGMIVLPAALLLLFLSPAELRKKRLYAALLLVLALSIPHFIHLYAVRGEGWGVPAGTSKFALEHFTTNFGVNFLFYFKNRRFPILFTLFFVAGIGLPLLQSRHHEHNVTVHDASTAACAFFWKEKLVVLVWFLAFWGIFLFFYAGSYNYGADVRFSLMSYLPLSILAGFGAAAFSKWCMKKFRLQWISYGLVLLIFFCFIDFLPYIRAVGQEAWDSRADHDYAELMAQHLPPHSLILTHNPNMFLLWGKNAAQASLATHDNRHLRNLFQHFYGGIYFHYNYWCTVQDEMQRTFCDNILQKFNSTEIVSFQEQNKTFRLYKIELK